MSERIALFRAALGALEAHHGSQNKAAQACGFSRQRWAFWRAGSIPMSDAMDTVIEAARAISSPTHPTI